MSNDGTTEPADAWPADFDDADAIEHALFDDDEPGELEAWSDQEEPDQPAPEGDDGVALAAGITSHQLRIRLRDPATGRYFINDNSTFRIPHTDQFQVRVALFNRAGSRVYLGPFRAKGGGTGYNTLIHREAVWDDGRLTFRSLVLWRSVNGGSVWTDWAQG